MKETISIILIIIEIVFKINDRDYKKEIFIPRGETVLANFKEFICEAIKQELLKDFKFM